MKRFYALRSLFALLLLISSPALACQLTAGSNEETPELVAEATVPIQEEGEQVGETATAEPPPFPDLQDMNTNLEGLDSYRMEVSLSFAGTAEAGAKNGAMRIQTAQVVEPPASEVVVTLEGDLPDEMEGAGTLRFVEIGEQSYTVLPGFGCVAGTADELAGTTDEFGDVIETEDVLGEIGDAEYLGEETVDGVATFHYRFDESNVEQEEGLEEMEGHVYISQELGYVVRMVVDGTGEVDLFDTGEMQNSNVHLEYNVTGVNAAIVIEPPEECASTGSEFPILEGATDLASMAGFTSYKVRLPLADVVAFYDTEMAALGYQADEEQIIFEETAILGYSQDGRNVSVTVTEDAGVVSVVITSGDGQ